MYVGLLHRSHVSTSINAVLSSMTRARRAPVGAFYSLSPRAAACWWSGVIAALNPIHFHTLAMATMATTFAALRPRRRLNTGNATSCPCNRYGNQTGQVLNVARVIPGCSRAEQLQTVRRGGSSRSPEAKRGVRAAPQVSGDEFKRRRDNEHVQDPRLCTREASACVRDAADGATVIFPSGRYTWSQGVTLQK